jgi:hypothetical protein
LEAVGAILLIEPEPPKNADNNRPKSIDEFFVRTGLTSNDSFNEPAFIEIVVGQAPRL